MVVLVVLRRRHLELEASEPGIAVPLGGRGLRTGPEGRRRGRRVLPSPSGFASSALISEAATALLITTPLGRCSKPLQPSRFAQRPPFDIRALPSRYCGSAEGMCESPKGR